MTRRIPWLELAALTAAMLLLLNASVGLVLRSSHGANPDAPPPQRRQAIDDADPLVVLGIGIDHRPAGGSFQSLRAEEVRTRSDTLLVGVLERSRGRATIISIPRDTLVAVPGRGQSRINNAFADGGIQQLIPTVEELLGIEIHRFVIVDFNGFKAFIDNIGGITVTVEEPLRTPSGIWLDAGEHTLDGDQALRFVRHRYSYLRQDLDRVEQQRKFLIAVANRVKEEGWLGALYFILSSPDLYKSNFTARELLNLYPDLQRLDLEATEHYTLPGRLIQREYWQLDRQEWEQKRRELFR